MLSVFCGFARFSSEDAEALSPQTQHTLIKRMKNSLSKFAALAVGFAALASNAQAISIIGDISFTGSVQLNGTYATATQVTHFYSQAGNIDRADVDLVSGDYDTFVNVGDEATMAAPWIFNPSTATNGLWSVGGFTFDLTSSVIDFQSSAGILVSGTGTVSHAGFDDTTGSWRFSTNSAQNQATGRFTFSAGTASVPEGGFTLSLRGGTLIVFGLLRRKFSKA
jgi:hypothetical protein